MKKTFLAPMALALTITACNLPGSGATEVSVSPTPMQEIPATLPADGVNFAYPPLYGNLPNGLGDGTTHELTVDVEFPYVNPSIGDMPQHTKIIIQNYLLHNTFFTAHLMIFNTAEYAQYSGLTAAIITDLTAYNSGLPATDDLLVQMLSAQIQPTAFKNGKGIRFLAQASGFPAPINNYELFYYFQGLTDDGQYFVQAILPVSAPFLASGNTPDTASFPADAIPFEWENMETHAVYYETVARQINTAPPDTFLPSLIELDELIQSLEVRP